MNRAMFAGMLEVGMLLLVLSPSIIAAQPAPFPSRTVPFASNADRFRGAIGPEAEDFTASRQVVRIPGAFWLQLRIGDHNLGAESYITVTSLKDDEQQRLDAKGLRLWQNQTAMFNGGALEVELHVAPGEEGIFFRIDEVVAGESVSAHAGETLTREALSADPRAEAICGMTDDRIASTNRGVGRTAPGGCTAWIVSNGAYLTAGHCTPGATPPVQLTAVHFSVPTSQANGVIVAPPLADQYPVVPGSIVFASNGRGDDWAVFNLGPDAAGNNRLAVHAQGSFFRMSRDLNPANFRITGHGLDGPAPCFGDSRQPGCITPTNPIAQQNADNQVQQTHAGQSQGESGTGANVRFQYTVDTQGGNSGSPIIDDGTGTTVGIHTAAGCSGTGGANVGTSFENDDLETAIRDFSGVGANVRHLDNDSVDQALQDGTVFRPFDTLAEAVNAVPVGGVVSIVNGSYDGGITINRAMTLRAPVGRVTID